MNPALRIELEMKAREVAIELAQRYGKKGIQFFHSQFLSIAEEYADAYLAAYECGKYLDSINPSQTE